MFSHLKQKEVSLDECSKDSRKYALGQYSTGYGHSRGAGKAIILHKGTNPRLHDYIATKIVYKF